MSGISRYLSISFFFFCLFLGGCQSQTKIVNGINGREANEIVVLLNSRGIQAQKIAAVATGAAAATTTEQLWDVSVPSSQITEALAILNQAGLPRTKGTTLLDLFGTQGLVPSDLQDRIRYQEGLSEQIATTIRKMDGVIDANVQISFPQNEEEQQPLTASVYVKHHGALDNPNSLLVTKIKRLVASAVPGLTIDNVSVVADRASYSDVTLGSLDGHIEEKDYVSIWSIIIAKESVPRFRTIFYLFIVLLFILACAVTWLIWKFYPLILARGGFKNLLKAEQIQTVEIREEKVEKVEEEEGL